jgi:hypothetical protein
VIDFYEIKRDESGVAVDGRHAGGLNLRRAALSFLEAVRW